MERSIEQKVNAFKTELCSNSGSWMVIVSLVYVICSHITRFASFHIHCLFHGDVAFDCFVNVCMFTEMKQDQTEAFVFVESELIP